VADYRCARCQWANTQYDVRLERDVLTCRKDPPTLRGSGRGVWPFVGPQDWCGQFSPKRQAPWTATEAERVAE
jgi:hypothetical protein